MPVDLGIPNLIIRAFQAGREEKMRQEELALRREQEAEIREQRKAELKERQHQFDIEEKRRKEEFEATNKIAQGTAALQKLKGLSDITAALEAGQSIPGVSRIATAKLGESQVNTFRTSQELGGDVFAARDPLTAARQTAEMQEILLQPKTKSQMLVERAKSVSDFARQQALSVQGFEQQKVLRQLTEDSRKTLDEYRQRQANYRAGLRGKGTTSNNAVRIIASAHDANPLTKRSIIAQEAVNFVTSLDINTKSSADDIGLIYAFAKAMDPDSVVREGEYATVQKYSQSWKDRFGFSAQRILNNTEFLTPESRTNLKQTILSKANSTAIAYEGYRKSIVNRLNKFGANGEDFLGERPITGGTVQVTRDPKTGKLK